MSAKCPPESSGVRFGGKPSNQLVGAVLEGTTNPILRDDSGLCTKPDDTTCLTSHRSPRAFAFLPDLAHASARCHDAISVPPRLGRVDASRPLVLNELPTNSAPLLPRSQEWIATRPSSGPCIWAALLHRTVARSGLQRHREVYRLRIVVELPATAMPLHGAHALV